MNNNDEYKNRCYNKCPQNTLELNHLCIDSNIDTFNSYSILHEDGKPLILFRFRRFSI